MTGEKSMIELDFSRSGGLIPAIAQDAATGEILMQAWIDERAFRETLMTGFATYYSRSRRQLWRKGESSGCRQKIVEVLVDCDCDSVIYRVEQLGGAACHTGHRSCFYRRVTPDGSLEETDLPVFDPAQVYDRKKEGKA